MMTRNLQFNTEQRTAIDWNRGSILVRAGPGSGKTTILTYRIARILRETKGQSFGILGLTFTDKAATEMKRRIQDLVVYSEGRLNISTFHSFSSSLLRQHGHHIGIRPDFIILSQESERKTILNEAMELATPHALPDVPRAESLLLYISRLMHKNATYDEAITFLQNGNNSQYARYIGEIYKNYRDLMVKHNELDFDGLVAEALNLLENAPVRKLTRTIYPCICVDEFQDTTLAQYKMLCHLVDDYSKNLFVVSDINQSIYGWNGSDPNLVRNLIDDFNPKILHLPESFRCPQQICQMAHNLISNTDGPGTSNSNSIQQNSENVRYKTFDDIKDEIQWVADDIAKSGTNGCAVVARQRKLLQLAIDALNKNGIVGYMPRKYDFSSNEMAWLYSMLQLADARSNGTHLRKACKTFYVLTGIKLVADDIISNPVQTDDYLRGWQQAALQNMSDANIVSFLKTSIKHLADRLDVWRFLDDCFRWFDQQNSSSEPNVVNEYEEDHNVWNNFIASISDKYGKKQATLNELLLEFKNYCGESYVAGDVPCYTIHTSKGLEFDHVYLIGIAEGELPHWQAIKKGDQSANMQEERRLCFVAVTRARKRLTLTNSHNMFGWAKQPSRFISEMGIS